MSDLFVDSGRRTLRHDTDQIDCLIGKTGSIAAAAKAEGDGKSPIGRWPLRTVLLRPDRVPLPAGLHLPWRWISLEDGWSDDPRDAGYNQPVRHPHPYSAERLWREDGAYDVIVVLRHNDTPPFPGRGSAIFLHCIADGSTFTEGCVAIARDALLRLLPELNPGDSLVID